MRFPWIALLASVGSGCTVGTPDGGGIEITGYLDESRISWTFWEGEAQAAGADGAAPAGADLALVNVSTRDEARGQSSVEGTFALAVAARPGHQLELRLVHGPTDEALDHDVATDRPAFPDPVRAQAVMDPRFDAVAVVEVAFEPPLQGGHVWAVNHDRDAAVVALQVFDGGAIHGGELHAIPGNLVLLYWVPAEGPESLPLELRVADPRR